MRGANARLPIPIRTLVLLSELHPLKGPASRDLSLLTSAVVATLKVCAGCALPATLAPQLLVDTA